MGWFLGRWLMGYCVALAFWKVILIAFYLIADLQLLHPLVLSLEVFFRFQILILTGITAALSYIFVGRLGLKLSAIQQMDTPNHRSLHQHSVPRGGGWAFVLSLIAIQSLIIIDGEIFDLNNVVWPHIAFLLGIIGLALISWRDDCGGLPARWRLLGQLAATLPVVIFHGDALLLLLPTGIPLWLGYSFFTIMWVGFINLYNFMDGIDGITSTETITIAIGCLTVLISVIVGVETLWRDLGTAERDFKTFFLLFAMLGASLGFLPHNWHPAKIFLGDIGSVTIGYVLGFCLLNLAAMGYWYAALTLPLYYLADGGITLLRRILRGERFWEAHRTHFYQRAALAAGRHDVVVKKIALCNAVLIIIAVSAVYLHKPWLCLFAPVPVALLLYNLSRQKPVTASR